MAKLEELEKVSSPEELLKFLQENIKYGVIDKNGNKFYDSSTGEFQQACNDWYVRSISQILEDGVGHCLDFTEVERHWFEINGYNYYTNRVIVFDEEVNNRGLSHAYLIYQDKETKEWVHFEVSDAGFRGLHKYPTKQYAINGQAKHQMQNAKILSPQTKKFMVEVFEFDKPKVFTTYQEYNNLATKNNIEVNI